MRNLQTLRLPLLFRTLFTVGFVTLLMIDVFVLQNNNEVDKTKETTTAATMNNSIIHAKGVEKDLGDGSKYGDLSYGASKRKVPRGPDPIHNRYFTGFLIFLPPYTLRTSSIESRKFKTTTGKRMSTVKAWRRSRENERSICWQNRFL
ncbi:BnaCnng22520D [Brassica napus]|uniref:BnaCnng22520D protein n=1 Tax=Brassica napus TaxID=3708 RepID=A0A078IN06_BRANA|nr:BnaCnng22520D [Brassica napus]